MIRYEKIGQFELKRDVALIVLCVRFLCHHIYCKYIVLFIILNPDQRKIESKKGFGHHVEGMTVDVSKNSNEGSRKCFNVSGISCRVDRKCVNADKNGFNVDGNGDAVRGKWNDASTKTLIVKGKCVIVSKKTK